MPVYCYSTEDGRLTVERVFSVADRKAAITLDDGTVLYRDIAAEHRSMKGGLGCWPQYSLGAGCARHQVKEFTEKAAARGVPTEFTPDGRAIFTSRGHRKRYLKSLGGYDNDAGYGDPAPE